jgi:CRISPR-associated endoribonuclease Cas6
VKMLCSLVALLEAESLVTIPATHGESMQSELFRQLQALDSDLTTRVHGESDDQPRPYTISPLYPDRPRPRNGMLYFQPGDRAWFRLTGLHDDATRLVVALSKAVRLWRICGSSFGGQFAIRRWISTAREHPAAGIISLDQMGQAAWHACDQEPDRIRLRFHTPTTFEVASESKWGSWMPLPIPKLVFGSLRSRAARFCPELGEPPSQAELVEGRVALGRFHSLESHMLHFQRRDRRRTGFTGECEFLLDRDLALKERLWLHLLAGFAFYSGIGASTSWGMGQAWREPFDSFLYRGNTA